MRVSWQEEADVVVIGYGGAGAVAAINAHDSGVSVLMLEKQACDTPSETRHVPNTRMATGGLFSPTKVERAVLNIEAMIKAGNESTDNEHKALLHTFVEYLVDNLDWLTGIGFEPGGAESMMYVPPLHSSASGAGDEPSSLGGRFHTTDYPQLPGSEQNLACFPKISGKYRNGAALFKVLSEAVQKRRIPVMWETPASHLVMEGGEIRGVIAKQAGGREIAVKARRAVVLTCGGFEYNDWLKENYLRVHPSHFLGTPSNTGDGIHMAMEAGASLWHMNNAAWRVVMKFPDFPVAFSIRGHETAVLVDKVGRRFTNEKFKIHGFGYELTNYDAYALTYPKVPCYCLFDEKRMAAGGIAGFSGACNPPGGIMGDLYYLWSQDNKKEMDRGWIMAAGTLEGLVDQILKDPANKGLMDHSVLRDTINRYNAMCHSGEDIDFHKPGELMQPLEGPPYYAVTLWPGGPNTQGGPKRNAKGQVLRVDNTPVPRLYAAGELGSVWGMIYQAGGNLAECIAFGRISGANAAAERPWED